MTSKALRPTAPCPTRSNPAHGQTGNASSRQVAVWTGSRPTQTPSPTAVRPHGTRSGAGRSRPSGADTLHHQAETRAGPGPATSPPPPPPQPLGRKPWGGATARRGRRCSGAGGRQQTRGERLNPAALCPVPHSATAPFDSRNRRTPARSEPSRAPPRRVAPHPPSGAASHPRPVPVPASPLPPRNAAPRHGGGSSPARFRAGRGTLGAVVRRAAAVLSRSGRFPPFPSLPAPATLAVRRSRASPAPARAAHAASSLPRSPACPQGAWLPADTARPGSAQAAVAQPCAGLMPREAQRGADRRRKCAPARHGHLGDLSRAPSVRYLL